MHTDRLHYRELLTTTVQSNQTLGVGLRAWMAHRLCAWEMVNPTEMSQTSQYSHRYLMNAWLYARLWGCCGSKHGHGSVLCMHTVSATYLTSIKF